ncbi:MAG TPA: hypothetical protein VFG78_01420 [Gemmatimonadota bacterium]|nr:hypothetical protein [Gemmatimonadota bacterium]
MELRCPQCGTVYDVSGYAPGHTFACACGQTLKVSAAPVGGAPPQVRGPDPGLPGLVKALVFFANLCFSPLSAIIALIVWLLIRDDKPRTADDLCKFTWIPFVLWILLVGLYMVFAVMFGLMDSMGGLGQ